MSVQISKICGDVTVPNGRFYYSSGTVSLADQETATIEKMAAYAQFPRGSHAVSYEATWGATRAGQEAGVGRKHNALINHGFCWEEQER